MKYKDLLSIKVSLATILTVFLVLELLVFVPAYLYVESPTYEAGIGGGLFLAGVLLAFSIVNGSLFLVYIVRVILHKSKLSPIPFIALLLCLWLGMLCYR